MPNFRELRQCEVRRISIPRTPVNKGKKKGRGSEQPRPSLVTTYGLEHLHVN
jgi:hypothetical protein